MRSLFDLAVATLTLVAVTGCGTPATRGSAPPRPNRVEKIRGTDVTFELVWVPEGRFWIGRTEVTWDEYLQYCDFDKAGRAPPGVDAISKPSRPLDDVAPFDRDWGVGRRPAVGMSWNAAKQYCAWLSRNTGRHFRLPTETEWLLACGVRPRDMTEVAWCAANSGKMTQPVASKRANALGIHDMFGNLWEYCADPFDPRQPDRAALRGGCWEDPPERIDPRNRLRFDPTWVLDDPNVPPGRWWVPEGNHLGFRVLCEDS
ncbi:MAG: SUMF1/EgtB/PvdO family nonheme iron enzyme [Planctomycetes bacterium]|nr:SUMF1/EgtB/PvdO family nonheme iron enzyme [Planctomycetota bacterium]